jgi:DNA repair protein RadD
MEPHLMQLRPYQRESIDALYAYWRKKGGNALIVLPTGSGKSLVNAQICKELIDKFNLRINIVTHVRELIIQTYKEMLELWPAAPVGIHSAGVGRRDIGQQILLCGIQSVYNKTEMLGNFDLTIVDECHLISRRSTSMYGQFFDGLRQNVPDMRVVGTTATAFRLDSGRLDYGEGRLFDKVVYEANITDLINQGYLSPLLSKATLTLFDISGVQKRGGEYIPGQLEVAVDKDWITRSAAEEMYKYGENRRSWLAFCSGIGHAEHMAAAIRATGVTCECVTGETPKAERDSYIRQFSRGEIRCLTSVGILGTGFNVPQVDLIALLRPTQSAGLFVQQVGRGLRKAAGKANCLVLDFARNTERHGPIDTITARSVWSSSKEEDRPALSKTCPVCQTILALAATQCPTCGHLFPRDELPKHEATADANTSILSKGAPNWVDVDRVRYYIHEKAGSPNSLRVEYHCGFTVHKEWLGFQHIGMMRQRAEHWWTKTAGTAIPRTTAEAYARVHELKIPLQICVQPDGKYFRIIGARNLVAKPYTAPPKELDEEVPF